MPARILNGKPINKAKGENLYMRISVLTGLLACTLVFAHSSESAGATVQEQTNQQKKNSVVKLLSLESDSALIVLADSDDRYAAEQASTAAEVPPAPIVHAVAENESLSDIAKLYETTWQRIYDKNESIVNPDVITVGMQLTIPTADEQLVSREIPVVQPVIRQQAQPRQTSEVAAVTTQPRPTGSASSSGNRYVAGYCTWYVKNRRADLPNNLGNASAWVANARAQGMATGSAPVAGAVGQRGNHVVYVESVNADGTVTISEMNHKGLYVMTTRTLPASYFTYIY